MQTTAQERSGTTINRQPLTGHVLSRTASSRHTACVVDETRAQAGRKIAEHRELAEFTQRTLATAADVSESSVRRLEEGKRLRPGTEAAIAKAMGFRSDMFTRIHSGQEPVPLGEDEPATTTPGPVSGSDLSSDELYRMIAVVDRHLGPKAAEKLLMLVLRERAEAEPEDHEDVRIRDAG